MSYSGQASGNVNPCRFVKSSGTGTIAQAGVGDATIGISFKGTRRFPIDGLESAYLAISGENCPYYTVTDEEAFLELGAGGATAGDYLKPDANGKGVVGSANLDKVGARCLITGAAGDIVRVRVYQMERSV